MRQKRAKTYRKLMHLYNMFFGFRQPYQVLVDSSICKIAIELNYDLVKHLGTALQGEVKPMITQCCIHELYLEGKSTQPAVDLAKTFERRKCNHREVIPGDECISNVVGESNKHRYIVSTQSQPLRAKLRMVPAVPLLHMNRGVLILEPPSDATLKAKQAAEEKALHAPASDIPFLKSSAPQPQETLRKKRKAPKAPNPLSMKKKKVQVMSTHTAGKSHHPQVLAKRKRDADDADNEPNPEPSERKRRRRARHKNDNKTEDTFIET